MSMHNENKIKLISIKGYNTFKYNFEKSKKLYLSNAIIAYRNDEKLDNNIIQFGVTISKKVAKKAVIRNRIKRLLRESIRQILNNNNEKLNFNTMILIWRQAPKMQSLIKLKDIKPIIDSLFKDAIYKSNSSK